MKSKFNKALEEASEFRALVVLLVVIALRAKRLIPTLRPGQMLIPATLIQIIIFVISTINLHLFIQTFAVGNFIVVGIVLLPSLMQEPKSTVHWVKKST